MNAYTRAALYALVLLALSVSSQAQTTYFPGNATISTPLSTSVVVGYANDADYNANPPRNPTSPTVNLVEGGSVTQITAFNSSILNISGGDGGGSVAALDNSTLNLSGGLINGILGAGGTSRVNISGGTITQSVYATGDTVFNVTGGTMYDIFALERGTVNLSGGHIRFSLIAENATLINLYGLNLSATLINPDFYDGTIHYSNYSLSGTLRDGTTIDRKDMYIQNGTGARFTLINVPAPSSALVLLFGVLPGIGSLLRRQRRGSVTKSGGVV